MVKIVDDLARATELVRVFARGEWDRTLDGADRDALVWLLEVAGVQHAYIRSRAFRDVVTAAYQMGRQAGMTECAVGMSGAEVVARNKQTSEVLTDARGE